MSTKETGGPAFPLANSHRELDGTNWEDANGMTLRQYAAIKLKVPDSGTDWLDEMITTSLRDDFAKRAMLNYAIASYAVADAVLEARKS